MDTINNNDLADKNLKLRSDVGIWAYGYKNNNFCLGSKAVDRYLVVSKKNLPMIKEALNLFDGKTATKAIVKDLSNIASTEIAANKLIDSMCNIELFEGISSKTQHKSEASIMASPLFKFNVEKFFNYIQKLVEPIYFLTYIIFILLIIMGGILFLYNLGNINMQNLLTINDYYILGWLIAVIFLIPSVVIHEIAHGVVASRYKLIPSEARIAAYMNLVPMLYLKIPGLYTVAPKARIRILAAGITANLSMFCFINIVLFFYAGVISSIIEQLLWKTAISNLSIMAFSLSPVGLTDGYFIFSILLDQPNFRTEIISKFASGKSDNRLSYYRSGYLAFTIILSIFAVGSLYLWLTKIIEDLFHLLNLNWLLHRNLNLVLAAPVIVYLLMKWLQRFKQRSDNMTW